MAAAEAAAASAEAAPTGDAASSGGAALGEPQEAWADWSFVFRTFAAAISPALLAAMQRSEASPDLSDPIRVASRKLNGRQHYYLLCLSAHDKALGKLRRPPVGKGCETWRLIVEEWGPRLRYTVMWRLRQRIRLTVVAKADLREQRYRACCAEQS